MKTILVASDLSERSDLAVARAGAIAKASGARLVVLMVVDEDLPEALRGATVEVAQTMIEDEMKRLGVEGEARIEVGDAAQDIPRVADEIGADLMVLGLHRLRPIMDLFSGATMERIVRASERPVLIARDPIDPEDDGLYKTVLVGVDLSPASTAAIRAADALAPESEIIGFHAYDAPFKGYWGDTLGKGYQQDAEREVERWLGMVDLPDGMDPPRVLEGSVSECTEGFFRELKPDLIAIGAHGRSSLSPTYLGAYTQEMMRRPPCDLLVVRR